VIPIVMMMMMPLNYLKIRQDLNYNICTMNNGMLTLGLLCNRCGSLLGWVIIVKGLEGRVILGIGQCWVISMPFQGPFQLLLKQTLFHVNN
jgi:hypothetical protein